MRIVAVYDDGSEMLDRYTVVVDEFSHNKGYKEWSCICLSDNPCHPWGVCEWSTCQRGRHLGKKIQFENLPIDVQQRVNYMIKHT